MRKFFGKFVSVTLAAVVIAMFALSSDDKWCSRVDKAFDESALGSFLNESKAGYGRYATGLPGQAASVLADSGENGENGENGGNGGNGENSGNEQDIGQTADTASTHRAADRDYEETDKISDGIRVEGVYACGRLTGIYEQTEGVLVVNTTEVTDEDGKKVNPADKRVQCGDYILSVNGRTVADKDYVLLFDSDIGNSLTYNQVLNILLYFTEQSLFLAETGKIYLTALRVFQAFGKQKNELVIVP